MTIIRHKDKRVLLLFVTVGGLNFNNVIDGHYDVPYTDKSLAFDGSVAYFDDKADSTLSVNKIYQHDTLPATWEYGNSSARYAANKFTITNDGVVKAFGFRAIHPFTEYEIKFFTTISGSNPSYTFSNQIGSTQSSVSALSMGWHTIKLTTHFNVQAAQTLIAQIRLINSDNYQIPVEADSVGYIDAESSYGESFYSQDGATFQDLKTLFDGFGIADANLALKVLVDDSVGADNATLSDLSVENTGGGEKSIGIYNSSASPTLTNVTATVSGGSNYNYSIFNTTASPTLNNITATALGGTDNYGIVNFLSSPVLNNVTAMASGGTNNHGIYNTSSSPTLNNVTVTASEGISYGIYNDGTIISPKIYFSRIAGGTDDVYIVSGTPKCVYCTGNNDAALNATCQ